MNSSHDGLTLWYGTPDAPAPPREVAYSRSIPLVVGVRPVSPANFVDVFYRVDGGPLRSVQGTELRTDPRQDAHYFKVNFPIPPDAKRVDYRPVAYCGGAQVPRSGASGQAEAWFALSPAEPTAPVKRRETPGKLVPRFVPGLSLAAQVTVQLKPPTIIGKTPHGFRIDYYARSGTVIAETFKAEVLEDSVDYMLVRPDGVGVLEIHATLRTDSGTLITATYGGLIEFGEDGYERMASGNWPEMPTFQVAPRMLTESSQYRWLNRTQFVGAGQVDMKQLVIKYDIYALSTETQPGAWGPK